MSLETWVAEFYPVSAWSLREKGDAVAHSLRKWEGLRWKNRKKHGLRMLDGETLGFSKHSMEADTFGVTADSCALCQRHLTIHGCGECPLKRVLGMSCDAPGQPYVTFLETGNPKPMIAALKAAAKLEAKK